MSQAVAIVFGAGLIALAIMVTHHWELIPGGANSLSATIRLNRWTGSMDVCALDGKTLSYASGIKLTCTRQ
jgi:hypothetical protein